MKIQKICITIILFAAICSPTLTIASEESHRAAINEMLHLSNVDKMIEPMFGQFKGLLKNKFSQIGGSDKQMPILEKYDDKLLNVMKEDMAWSKMRDDYIDIYAKVYTEEEILDINKFYRSPAGKKMIEKMPQLLQETMTVTQKSMQKLIPKLQQISEEMAQEIQNSK